MTARILLVLASRRDAAATRLAGTKAGFDILMMTPEDLSQEGWNVRLHDPTRSTAVVAGSRLPHAAIAGVLTRLPAVTEDDLPHIAEFDRSYVAAEMNAFLLAWLTSLRCPVLNRPTPEGLSGPHWRQERWVLTAAKLGIPAQPVVRCTEKSVVAAAPEPVHMVTVVGRRHVGAVDKLLIKRAHALARAAGVDLLSAQFDGAGPDAKFVNANLWPDVGDLRIADAVLALLQERANDWTKRGTRHDIAVGNLPG